MAPEAKLLYFGQWKAGHERAAAADALDFSTVAAVDIVNMSVTFTPLCDPEATNLMEMAVENAFDNGVVVVVSAGNNDGPTSTGCNVEPPADLVKSVAVNAYDACAQVGSNCSDACQDNPNLWCLVDQNSSARGGKTVAKSGGGNATLSLIDLVAPNNVTRYTHATGEGWVDENRLS